MPLDPYSLCPGGTGKKLKFCCSDLLPELEKIQRMLEGDQRAACLEHIESIESKYPDRACLMSVQAMLYEQVGQHDKATAVLNRLVEKDPHNPVALAEQAMLKATNEGGRAAVDPLLHALEGAGAQMPAQLYEALGVVAEQLVADGDLLAARRLLLLQLGISGAEDKRSLSLLVRLNTSPAVPVLLKQDLAIRPCPADAPYRITFDRVLEVAKSGHWREAAAQFEELARSAGDWPAIWSNVAALRSWLADPAGTVAALHKLAEQDVPLDDAVEAEALAQLLDPATRETIDVVTIEYGITDLERLLALLAASRQTARMNIDLASLGGEDEPPPRAAFWLLDRPVPESGVGIARGDVPRVVGQVFVFGRQTDRPERLELLTYRTPELERSRQVLADVAAESLGPSGKEEVTAQIPALQHALSWNWRLPDDTPREHRAALIEEQRRHVLLEEWPRLPQQIFGGKTAAEVAADPAYQRKVLGAILLLEQSPDQAASEFDFNQLRGSLKLPIAGPIDPTGLAVRELPLVRLARLEVAKLSDEDLVHCYHRAEQTRYSKALRAIVVEVVARASLDEKVDKAAAYGVLAQSEPNPTQAIEYVAQARRLTEAKGGSSAPWDMVELSLQIARGELETADRLLEHIRTEHIREPGVAQALVGLLTELGIMRPDGRPAAPPPGAAAPEIAVPGAAQEPGQLWTPDGPSPAGGKKTTIWTPD